MDSALLKPLSGFRDLASPTKEWVIDQLRQAFLSFGYQPLETPALERQEILLNKIGPETQKQLYLFEDQGKRRVGLRYDLTVSMVRYLAGNWRRLAFPFRRYEIGLAWRAEKAQRGRLRQFTQADIDFVGEGPGEVEIFELTELALQKLGLKLTCRINDRAIVNDILGKLEIAADRQASLLLVLDKADKISAEELAQSLAALSLTDAQLEQVKTIFCQADDPLSAIRKLFSGRTPVSLDRFNRLMEKLQAATGLPFLFSPGLVRGAGYYTGTIFEGVTTQYRSSLFGGGRYDNFIGSLIGHEIPAVGLSFGVDNLVDLLESQGSVSTKPLTLFVVNLSAVEQEVRFWVKKLRQAGRQVDLYPDSEVSLSRQLKYATKRAYRTVYLPLEEQWQRGLIVKKDLQTGSQEVIERQTISNV